MEQMLSSDPNEKRDGRWIKLSQYPPAFPNLTNLLSLSNFPLGLGRTISSGSYDPARFGSPAAEKKNHRLNKAFFIFF
jgi:hypothetical protein